jgi:hypothetical protein
MERRGHTTDIESGRIKTKPDVDHVFSNLPNSIVPLIEGVEGMPESHTIPSAHGGAKVMKTYKMKIAANMRIMNCQSIARSDLRSARLIRSELTYMTNTLPAKNQKARLLIS